MHSIELRERMLARNVTDVLRILAEAVKEGVKETVKVASALTEIANKTSE